MLEISYEEHYYDSDQIMPFRFSRTQRSEIYQGANWHKNIEIVFITGGEGYVRCDTKEIQVKKGDIIVVNSEVVHVYAGNPNISFDFVVVAEEFFEQNGIDYKGYYFKSVIDDEITRGLFMKLSENIRSWNEQRNDPLIVSKIRCTLLHLLIDLCERHRVCEADVFNPGNERGKKYVKKTMNFIRLNFVEPISLDDICNNVGISKYHLVREFKNYTGYTIFNYINILRCKRAEQLISEGKSITDAAFESGFANLPYFTKTYKKLMGMSPSEFKKKNR